MSCRDCGAPSHERCWVTTAHSTTAIDDVNHPPHYKAGKIEVIDFIEDQRFGYRLGNVVKYLCRHAHKGTPLKDLKKARWYLEREIAALEKEAP